MTPLEQIQRQEEYLRYCRYLLNRTLRWMETMPEEERPIVLYIELKKELRDEE